MLFLSRIWGKDRASRFFKGASPSQYGEDGTVAQPGGTLVLDRGAAFGYARFAGGRQVPGENILYKRDK